VIPPLFEDGTSFYEGLAGVQVKKRWGFADRAGQVVIGPAFRRADYFRDGLSYIEREATIGYIDHAGKVVWEGPCIPG
jgi:hypothetical protein